MMNDETVRRSGRGRKVFGIIMIVAAATFIARFIAISRAGSVESIESIQQKEGKPVETARASRGDLDVWTTLAGTVEGIVQYPIISTNSIQVMDVLRNEGDWVNSGDVVIRLEKAAANPMLHSYERSRVVYEDALRDVRRMRNLFNEGAVSEQMLDKAEMALKIAESDLQNAREGIDLVADYPGIVQSVLVEKGEMANNGSILVWVARTDTVKIAFEAGSRQAMILAPGQRAVWKNSYSGEAGEGEVGRIDLAADPETHLLGGEAVFPNPEGRLMPGLLVSFSVLTGERSGVLKIPAGCLKEANGGYEVYVVEKDSAGLSKVRLQAVETGLRTADEVEVVSGLTEGDVVVRFGQSKLEDGDPVKTVGWED